MEAPSVAGFRAILPLSLHPKAGAAARCESLKHAQAADYGWLIRLKSS